MDINMLYQESPTKNIFQNIQDVAMLGHQNKKAKAQTMHLLKTHKNT